MKVDFALPDDGGVHRICLSCHKSGVLRIRRDENIVYPCSLCGYESGRALYWGAGEEWLAEDGELWHAAAAVLVYDQAGRVLLYERLEYPYGLMTVPAGHIDKGEDPEAAGARELEEEVGIRRRSLTHAITVDLPDSCSGGADLHRWHVYTTLADSSQPISVTRDEGKKPIWVSPSEALALPALHPPVRRVLLAFGGGERPVLEAPLELVQYGGRAVLG